MSEAKINKYVLTWQINVCRTRRKGRAMCSCICYVNKCLSSVWSFISKLSPPQLKSFSKGQSRPTIKSIPDNWKIMCAKAFFLAVILTDRVTKKRLLNIFPHHDGTWSFWLNHKHLINRTNISEGREKRWTETLLSFQSNAAKTFYLQSQRRAHSGPCAWTGKYEHEHY